MKSLHEAARTIPRGPGTRMIYVPLPESDIPNDHAALQPVDGPGTRPSFGGPVRGEAATPRRSCRTISPDCMHTPAAACNASARFQKITYILTMSVVFRLKSNIVDASRGSRFWTRWCLRTRSTLPAPYHRLRRRAQPSGHRIRGGGAELRMWMRLMTAQCQAVA